MGSGMRTSPGTDLFQCSNFSPVRDGPPPRVQSVNPWPSRTRGHSGLIAGSDENRETIERPPSLSGELPDATPAKWQ